VLLVDSDPQGSARDWAAAHSEQPVPVIGIDRPIIEKSLKSIGRKDYIVIDGAPQLEALAVSAIKAANFVLIPVQPSPYDVWATADLVDLVKARMEILDGGLRAAFVISRAIKGTRIGNEITATMADYGLPVLISRITQRVIYPMSATTGQTVFEREPEGEAANEVRALVTEIKQLLNRSNEVLNK